MQRGVAADTQVAALPDTTAVGPVALTVADLDRAREFYEHVIGLQSSELEDGGIGLAAGTRTLLTLHADASAPARDPRAPGLFHFAILVPSRRDLAIALARLAQNRWPLEGASDHLVSEALYLSDPEGNGIEIYRDRPRDEWPKADGVLQMATLPLDLDDLLNELEGVSEIEPTLPPETVIGHVHLQVSDLATAEAFYHGILGFDVMVRGYPGALFVSAGGYHHHVGLNTWNSAGRPPGPAGSLGLRNFEVFVPDRDALTETLRRARAGTIEPRLNDDGWVLQDPSGNGVLLVAG